jgi:hypothetical protein
MFTLSKKKCLRTVKVYRSKPATEGTVGIFMEGVPCKNGMHKSLYGRRFSKKRTSVKGYTMEDFTTKNSKYSLACKERVAKKVGKLDLSEWIQKVRDHWLTIADVKQLKPGSKLKVVILDRNIYDYLDGFPTNKMLPPTTLHQSTGTYTHGHGMQGTLLPDHGPFEFHVEYEKGRWYPLRNGYLPAKDDQLGHALLGKKTHWTKMPPTTAVGFRGPMVRVSDLKSLPDFYVYEEFK